MNSELTRTRDDVQLTWLGERRIDVSRTYRRRTDQHRIRGSMQVQKSFTIRRISETFGSTIDGERAIGTRDHAHHHPRAIIHSATMLD
jgi:hypothetical protein